MYVFVCVWVCVRHGLCVDVRGQPVTELKSSGLAASTFTHGATLPAQAVLLDGYTPPPPSLSAKKFSEETSDTFCWGLAAPRLISSVLRTQQWSSVSLCALVEEMEAAGGIPKESGESLEEQAVAEPSVSICPPRSPLSLFCSVPRKKLT